MFSLDHKIKPYKFIKQDLPSFNFAQSWKMEGREKILYYDVPTAFDTETSSFYDFKNEKVGLMYEWTFGINGYVYYGRTWEEYLDLLSIIKDGLNVCNQNRLVIWVHNLSFDFQFLRKHLTWNKIFASNEREPLYAIDEDGFEYRCSYQLSGYSLAKLGENLTKYKVNKLVGDLDYSLIRTPLTPLTSKELAYCENDVKVVMAYIQEKLERREHIATMPFTKTGYVRNFARKYCFYNNGRRKENQDTYMKYRQIMERLTIEPEEYQLMKRAYSGGFTHANPFSSNKVYEYVSSYDFTSSYPTCILSEKFPISKGKKIEQFTEEELDKYLKYYCCIFDMEVWDLSPNLWFENPLSVSKCWEITDVTENNGRIVSASHLKTSMTNVDLVTFKEFYNYSNIKITNLYVYYKAYLPTNFIKAVLKLYQDKTTLKGVVDKEYEYQVSKENLNSCYGMCVTDIARPEVVYEDGEWGKKELDLEKELNKYNNSVKRFLFYGWGLFITAYARRNLFTGIKEFGLDYLYSDTDSLKVLNKDKHKEYIEKYNRYIVEKLEKAMIYHKLPLDSFRPKNFKGEEKCIGLWDYEGDYEKFKTLGAKRYVVSQKGKIKITISGLGKTKGGEYIASQDKPFDFFTDEMYVPKEHTGKQTHTYIDFVKEGVVKDYLGYYYKYKELSSVHLESCDFTMSISDKYLDYMLGVKEKIK